MFKIELFVLLCLALGSYAQDSVCGGKLFVENSVVIEVPQSSTKADCEWIVETDSDRILLLSTSNTNENNYRQNSIYTIYDGPSESHPQILLEYSRNNEAQSSAYSKSNSVLVRFQRSLINPLSADAVTFQLKIEKAVSCPPNLGGLDTSCARVVDNLSCYCVSTTPRNWTSSLRFCSNNKMQLVAIETAVEDRALYNAWGQHGNTWIAMTDQILEGEWFWYTTLITLNQTGYANWQPGEPNNLQFSAPGENCAEYYPVNGFGWNDHYCHVEKNLICENQP